LKVADPRAISWTTSTGFDYVDAEHDGYSRYRDPVTHRRAVFFVRPEYWVVVDQLMGRRKHSVEMLYHTPCVEHEFDRNSLTFRTQELAIIPVAAEDLDVNILECAEEPIHGWFSPCYGVRVPSATLVYSFTGELPCVMATILHTECQTGKRGRVPLRARRSVSSSKGLAINVELGDLSDIIVFNWVTETGVCSSVPLRTDVDTDAEVAYLRENKASGKITSVALINGKYIRLKGRLLLEAEAAAESIDLSVSPEGTTSMKVEPKMKVQFEP
jgi:hypothetical protein